MTTGYWQTSRYRVSLHRPLVMGIVNVTPDSFSDGGRHADPVAAMRHCDRLVQAGADILDIGGESTRPGSRAPSAADEAKRVMPVLRHAVTLGLPISLDSSQPSVMQAALDLGVDVINDVRALAQPGALAVVQAHPLCGVCLMHMQGDPATMQQAPAYGEDVVHSVRSWLDSRAAMVVDAGVARERIVIDPGIGFGKSHNDNWALLRGQSDLVALGYPLLMGWSRKSSLGELTGRSVDLRLGASVAAALACVQRGASIVRVHDVADTVDALKVWRQAGLPASKQVADPVPQGQTTIPNSLNNQRP